jgi:PAS domain S-box-containing protein
MGLLRILVVDDQEVVRQGIRDLLSPRKDWFICGEAIDGVDAIENAKRLHPDVVLMNVSMPRMDGMEATRIIRRDVPESDVIIISQNPPDLMRKAAADTGAKQFVDKSKISQDLLAAIEALAKERADRELSSELDMPTTPRDPLSVTHVRGTELVSSDDPERYRQKLARITLDSMVQFVGLLDARGTVLEINQVALDGVGVKLSEVKGRPFWTTFWWQVSDEINATLREMILRASKGEFVRWDTEIYGRASGKETIIIDASLMPVTDEQGVVVFITAEGRDITEKKAHEREIARQREELAKLDELKTQFFANISHEFRTPLTLMMGPLQDALVQSEGLSGADRERLELAHRNSLRLLKLVNTLLDFSRIEAGRIQASYESTDLSVLTAELASVFRSAVERAGMRLVIDCPSLKEMVYVDREMWEKIVLNLLSNAFKFTFEGEIEVSLRVAESKVELRVRDTGTGIPADEIPRLFERFHRVKGSRGRSYEGSGIGLAFVQELVKLHGGDVRVESEVDCGTVFFVRVPLGKDHLPSDRIGATRTLASARSGGEAFVQEALRWLPEDQAVAQETPGAPPLSVSAPAPRSLAESEKRLCILIADDNADMREYARRLLREQYDVVAVADGESALQRSREQRPDLILTDVMMPQLDGFGLLQAIRGDQALKDIPVILLSARAGEESRVEGLDSGADDYLVKPFSARELLASIRSNLSLARLRQEATERERKLRAEAELERNRIRELSNTLEVQVHDRTRELENRSAEILQQSEQLRELSNRLLKTQDEEKRRIARELHDSAGQLIAAVGMNLAGMERLTKENPLLVKAVGDSQNLLQQLNTEIRTTSYLLHPPLLDESGLSQAIRWYMQGLMERSGLQIELVIAEDFGRLSADLELAVFRIVQESLTNIHRHSGSRTATIRLSRSAETVSLEIRDQGNGISPEILSAIRAQRGGVGISGMRERVRHFNGQLDVQSNGIGATILVTFPLSLGSESAQKLRDALPKFKDDESKAS